MKLRVLCLAICTLPLTGCIKKGTAPGTSRESGQSRLMGQTFAGKNACSPENHLRPFIIEWDATDMSSFKSHASDDVVIVKYEGCELTVLDECRNDSIRGSQGSYKPPTWTSGSLEKIDITTAGELYAKLPLGSASLSGRVEGGEQFHMEYFVAGTRNSTRSSLYLDDLKDNPGCEGATHFVYAYNLGAFALGSTKDLATEFGGSYFGFGAGGSTQKTSSAEKKGGDLGTCKSESATEVQGCKAPIRLALREIRDGQDPQQAGAKAPVTDASLDAITAVNMKVEMSDQARSHLESARAKFKAGDGKGCLSELDLHDKLNAKADSQNPKSEFGINRAQCLMAVGKCKAGRGLAQKWMSIHWGNRLGPEQIDTRVEELVAQDCQGGNVGPRDRLLRAMRGLQAGALTKKETVAGCDKHLKVVKKLAGQLEDPDDDKLSKIDMKMSAVATKCFARAGDCKKAYAAYKYFTVRALPKIYGKMDKKKIDESLRETFKSMAPECK